MGEPTISEGLTQIDVGAYEQKNRLRIPIFKRKTNMRTFIENSTNIDVPIVSNHSAYESIAMSTLESADECSSVAVETERESEKENLPLPPSEEELLLLVPSFPTEFVENDSPPVQPVVDNAGEFIVSVHGSKNID